MIYHLIHRNVSKAEILQIKFGKFSKGGLFGSRHEFHPWTRIVFAKDYTDQHRLFATNGTNEHEIFLSKNAQINTEAPDEGSDQHRSFATPAGRTGGNYKNEHELFLPQINTGNLRRMAQINTNTNHLNVAGIAAVAEMTEAETWNAA